MFYLNKNAFFESASLLLISIYAYGFENLQLLILVYLLSCYVKTLATQIATGRTFFKKALIFSVISSVLTLLFTGYIKWIIISIVSYYWIAFLDKQSKRITRIQDKEDLRRSSLDIK